MGGEASKPTDIINLTFLKRSAISNHSWMICSVIIYDNITNRHFEIMSEILNRTSTKQNIVFYQNNIHQNIIHQKIWSRTLSTKTLPTNTLSAKTSSIKIATQFIHSDMLFCEAQSLLSKLLAALSHMVHMVGFCKYCGTSILTSRINKDVPWHIVQIVVANIHTELLATLLYGIPV